MQHMVYLGCDNTMKCKTLSTGIEVAIYVACLVEKVGNN